MPSVTHDYNILDKYFNHYTTRCSEYGANRVHVQIKLVVSSCVHISIKVFADRDIRLVNSYLTNKHNFQTSNYLIKLLWNVIRKLFNRAKP